MITDIHEKIKEKIRATINQPDSDNIIAYFMSYSLPYRLDNDNESDKYAGDDPWSKIAKKIKENPDVLKSEDMAYAISASFRASNKIYSTDEFDFAFDIMEKLKVLKDDGIITEAQFQGVLGLKSPETGETLLTHTMKDALNLSRGSSNMQMFNRLLEVGLDVNIPNARGQYPIQIIQHYQNIRKKNIEYSIEKKLVSKDFINEDYTFPNEKRIVEERTSKEIIEKIKQNMAKPDEAKVKYKKTHKSRAFVSDIEIDVSSWRESGPQGYAYAINVLEPTYLTDDYWRIDTLISPGKYVVYEGRGENMQVIAVEEFYNNRAYLYLLDAQGKKLKEVDSREVLKTLAGGQPEKTLAAPVIKPKVNEVAKKIDQAINKNLDITNIKTGLKQLEGASDKLLKKITGKFFKK